MKTSTSLALALTLSLVVALITTRPFVALGSGKEFGYAMLEFGIVGIVVFVVFGAALWIIAKLSEND